MPTGILNSVPQIILSHNVTRLISDLTSTTTTNLLALAGQSTTSASAIAIGHTHIFLAACFGFVLLILATVVGNTLVLLALYLDKRLHSPSFYLIANMAVADLLLGKTRFLSLSLSTFVLRTRISIVQVCSSCRSRPFSSYSTIAGYSDKACVLPGSRWMSSAAQRPLSL